MELRDMVAASVWRQPIQVGTATRVAELVAPAEPVGWVLIGRSGGGDLPPVLRSILDDLHQSGLATMALPLPRRHVAPMAGWVQVAASHLRTEVAGDLPIAYLGARRQAPAGWLAALGGDIDGVMAWNGQTAPAWWHLPRVAVPSLLVLDADAARLRVMVAQAARWRLGAGAELVRRTSATDLAGLSSWYERRLLGQIVVAPPAARPWRLAPARRVASVAAAGALAVFPATLPAPASAMPDFSGGRRLATTQLAGDFAQVAATNPVKPGDKQHPPGVMGDPPLTDGVGLRWNINTNIGFTTTSSASGAVSEAGFTHAVAASTLNGGSVNAVLADAFDGYNALCVDLNNVGGQCNTANMAVYNQNGPASLECSGRQVVLPLRTMGSFQVRRKVFVPANDGFARWLNIFRNTSGAPQTVRLVTSNNLGGDANTRVVTTSDGDAVAELTDTWVTSFQNFIGTTSSDPRLGHVLRGPGAPVGLAALSFVNGDDNPFWRYQFTLAPGQTAIIMNFATGQATRAAAAAKAAELASLTNPNALACMTQAERAQVLNFLATSSLPGAVTLSTNWSLRDTLTSGPPTIGPFSYGTRPLVPLMGDWNGDGIETPGTYEAGVFKLRNSNGPGDPDKMVTFGDPRGFPLAGDFDGDRIDDLAVFRNGTWQIRYSGGTLDATFVFGSGAWPSTIPVVGDWNGDNIDGIGTYVAGAWILRNTASAGAADAGSFTYNPGTSPYPVVGDWNRDGVDTVGVKAGTSWLLRNTNTAGAADLTIAFGAANDFPVVWRG